MEEPKERCLTLNLNQFKLMPETCYKKKLKLTLTSPTTKKFFFFQISNHNSPAGMHK